MKKRKVKNDLIQMNESFAALFARGGMTQEDSKREVLVKLVFEYSFPHVCT